jgi:hypothetical protein
VTFPPSLLLRAERHRMSELRPDRGTRPATARIWRGAARQIAIADSTQQPMQIQNADA